MVFRKLKPTREANKPGTAAVANRLFFDDSDAISNGDRLSFFNYHGIFSTNNDEPGRIKAFIEACLTL